MTTRPAPSPVSPRGQASSRAGLGTGARPARQNTLLPDGASQFLSRRLGEAGGLLLVAVAGLLAASVVSYNGSDPSFSTAAPHEQVRNLLGVPGAYLADVLVQTFGIASFLLSVILTGWGLRIIRHDPPGFWAGRVVAGLFAVTIGAAALAGVSEPFGGTAGGGIGRMLIGLGQRLLLATVGWQSPLLPGLLSFVLAIILIIVALGVPFYRVGAALSGLPTLMRGLSDRIADMRANRASRAARPRGRDRYGESPAMDDESVFHPSSTVPSTASAPDSAPDGPPLPLLLRAGRWAWRRARGAWQDRQAGRQDGASRRAAAPVTERREPGFGTRTAPSFGGPTFGPGPSVEGESPRQPPAPVPVYRPVPVTADPVAGEPDLDMDTPPWENAPRAGMAAPGDRPPPTVVAPRSRDDDGARRMPPRQGGFDPEPDVPSEYELPPVDLLQLPDPGSRGTTINEDALRQNAQLLEGVLDDFGVKGTIGKVHPGPVVTLYELEPAPGTKSSRVIGLADDIARSMSAVSVRVAVVPGRNVIGVELPNARRETVYLRELLEAESYDRSQFKLALVLGKDIGGQPIIADLARMPHLLVAGTTGSGKSVAINTMILSLLYRLPPEKCRFIMVDPKMLELSVYEGIPHLLAPVVTDPKKAVVALKWAVREMEDRYRSMSKLGVRNIEGYNARLREARQNGESLTRHVQTGFDPDTGKPVFEDQPIDLTELPYIVVIVDEMADLMLVAGKDIEAAIQRLAQMARAAGIHIIMATQRPSVDVITGTIKANFPTRISFQVTSKIDSRTILGEQGAEQLLGQGDMLYMAGGGRITRVHGPFVRDQEVEEVVRFLKAQGEPAYLDAVTEGDEDFTPPDGDEGGRGGGAGGEDLYDQAVALVCRERKASTSFIQRHLRIGYNSAARLIEQMEREGVVSRANHVGKREVLARNIEDPEG